MQWPSSRDWILLVVDKVAWGGFLLLAAFWLNRRLERWRQATTANREWSKEEAKRIVEVLADFGDLEAATDAYLSVIGDLNEDIKGSRGMQPSQEKVEAVRM